MKNDIDYSKPYWFYISSDIYVSYKKDNSVILLYHTKTGEYLEINNLKFIQTAKDIYCPQNLGVVKIQLNSKEDLELAYIIMTIIAHKMGGVIEIKENTVKPINFLPILNLSKDVSKLQKSEDTSLIVDNLLSYLSELNLYLNDKCNNNCTLCDTYYKQVKSCSKSEYNKELPLDDLKSILKQIEYSSVKKINILGGNILMYSQLKELLKLFNKYDFEYHLWLNYQNIANGSPSFLKERNVHYEIIFTFPLNNKTVESVLTKYQKYSKKAFHFFIESEEQYVEASEFIHRFGLKDANLVPIYTTKNMHFFEDEIFLEKEDVFTSVISMRKIFCNQKLNTNYFGNISILSDGSAKANINAEMLGNIYENSILEILYKELTENTAWRKIRNQGKCDSCLYQFLCPPPSNYEIAIGKPNLCHIEPL